MNGPATVQSRLQEAERCIRAGRLTDATAACHAALGVERDNALALHYLGLIAWQSGRLEDALNLLDAATVRRPGEAAFWFSLGSLAGQVGLVDRSIETLERAVQLQPTMAHAFNDLGQALCLARRVEEAIECFDKAASLRADYVMAASNHAYYQHFHPARDGQTIRATCESWAKRFAEPLTSRASRPAFDRSPGRALRIGYVSPDLYEHPVGRFMQAILASHDRTQYQAICYSDCVRPGAMTQTLRSLSDGWRDTAAMSDEQLAAQIRQDRIDILVDLSLHMGRNRLLAFARRPAPVQATYLAYPGTSGMSAMDFRISDAHLDPAGNDALYTERTIRLPRSYWCYSAPPCAVEIGDVRSQNPGPIVFAAMNNLVKVSDAALATWGRVLARVPDSRLILHAQQGGHLAAMNRIIEQQGVDPRRVEYVGYRNLRDYFAIFEQADVALDSFPYVGGTTTCDAIWMGVPVVTLAGTIGVQRGGVSLLTNLGLPELIASTVEQYVEIASELASDAARLASLRAGLRRRIERSIVMNASEFTRDLEASYRSMWDVPFDR